jgi:acetylglutamate kinase
MLDSNVIVIKYGGSLLEDPGHRKEFLKDVAQLAAAQKKVVLVHGGGKEITRALEQKGIPARFVNGLRVTDDATMQVVDEVLARVNAGIVQELQTLGVRADGYSGKTEHLLLAAPVAELGRVGKPQRVNLPVLGRLLARRTLPVFYSVAEDEKGNPLNINADDFALAVALAARAERLVYLTDSGGILDAEKRQIASIDRTKAEQLIASGVITGGMMVKAQASVDAVEKGVGSVDITKNIKYLIAAKDASSAVTSFTKSPN